VDREARCQPNEPHPSCSGLRTILVPPDIVAVKRTSPLPARKRTPWRPRPDGEVATQRAGGREWFSDQLFVEPGSEYTKASFGTSMTAHVLCGIALLGVIVARAEPLRITGPSPRLVMPAMLVTRPPVMLLSEATRPAVDRAKAAAVSNKSDVLPAPVPAAALPGPSAAAPVDAPRSIEPETGIEHGENGVERGVAGGVPGGDPDVPASTSAAAAAPGPMRLGAGITPPRRIKDVKPIYPQGAVPGSTQGIVIIEGTVGVDGRVHDLRVLKSVPALDQAALEAVRQWVYVPAQVNGTPVAAILTIIVTFAIQ
jgi:protein TonB